MMTSTWERLINADIARNRQERTFEDGSTTYRFRINRVVPLIYATMPPIYDFTIFANIKKTDRTSEKTEDYDEVSLGTTFKSDPRRLIAHGEEYFDAISPEVSRIVGKHSDKNPLAECLDRILERLQRNF